MKDQFIRAGIRFVRAFVAGGAASVLALLMAGVPFKEFAEIRNLALPLAIAFLNGGLMGLDKLYRDAPQI